MDFLETISNLLHFKKALLVAERWALSCVHFETDVYKIKTFFTSLTCCHDF